VAAEHLYTSTSLQGDELSLRGTVKHFVILEVAMAAAFVLNNKLLYKLGQICINYVWPIWLPGPLDYTP
jgi:hypothetical protein